MKTLTDQQMKMINGGDHSICTISGGGGGSYYCNGSLSDCQDAADKLCAGDDSCDDLDCQPIYA